MKVFTIAILIASVTFATSTATHTALLKKLSAIAENKGHPESRIIDGENAAVDAAPFIVSISPSALVYAHYCSGTIIGKDWILTAAHCVSELEELSGNVVGLPIYAGRSSRSENDTQISAIDFAFRHKQFTGLVGSEDIALLHITPALNFSAHVQQVVLPYINEDYAGIVSTTYGWGLNDSEASAYESDLKVASASVLNSTYCGTFLPTDAPITERNLCASVTACLGDGGNPLVAELEGGIAELIGITSWAYLPCGYNSRPTVFTAVSKFVGWIAEVQWAYYILH